MRNIGFPERKRKKHKQVSVLVLQRFFHPWKHKLISTLYYIRRASKNFTQNIRHTKDLHYLCQREIYFIEAKT